MTIDRNIEILHGDRRRLEMKNWNKWLELIPKIRDKCDLWASGFDPFVSNEAASVAVLASAAAQIGYLTHTEFVTLKRGSTRGRPYRQGRCDLWVADVERGVSWAFEFKRCSAAANIRSATFDKKLKSAFKDAKDLDRAEANRRVGGLIMSPKSDVEASESLIKHFDGLCASSDAAFRIGGGKRPVWLAFKFVC